jgi:hypothetical protein
MVKSATTNKKRNFKFGAKKKTSNNIGAYQKKKLEPENPTTENITTDSEAPIPMEIGDIGNIVEEPNIKKYKPIDIKGLRIVNFQFFWNALTAILMHSKLFNCGIDCLQIYEETKIGLNSNFLIYCQMCRAELNIYTCEDPHQEATQTNGGVNYAAVLAITNIGSGFTNLKEFFAALNIPTMCSATFSKYQKKLFDHWTTSAEEAMQSAAAEERQNAIANGDIIEFEKDGRKEKIPWITVIVDACWAKRSYRKFYNSLSGAGSIIGAYTKKVLWIGE